jgi:hypothetical protein
MAQTSNCLSQSSAFQIMNKHGLEAGNRIANTFAPPFVTSGASGKHDVDDIAKVGGVHVS